MFHTSWPRLLRAFSIFCVLAFVSLTLATDKSQVDSDNSQLAATATETPTPAPTIDGTIGRFVRLETIDNFHISAAEWSPDGESLFTYSPIRGLSVHAVTSLNTSSRLSWYDEYTSSGISISPDGQLIAYGSSAIMLRSSSTGDLFRKWFGHRDHISFLEFSPDGRMLFSADSSDQYLLWDVPSGIWMDLPTNLPLSPYIARFSPDGTKIVLVDLNGQIYFLDVIDDTTLQLANNGNPLYRTILLINADASGQINFSPDGTLLAIANGYATVLWDVTSGQVVKTLRGHTDYVSGVSFSADRNILATGSKDGLVKLWYVPTGEELASFDIGDSVDRVGFNPTRMLLTVTTADYEVQIWGLANAVDPATATPLPTLPSIELTSTAAALTTTSTPTATLTSSGYLARGDAAFAARDYLAALADYDLALAIDNEDTAGHLARGHTLGELQRWDEAIVAYARALELDDDDASTYAYIARAYHDSSDDQATSISLDYANRALELKPDHALALVQRARAYYDMGRVNQAMVDLDRAIEIDPELSEAYTIRGFVYDYGFGLTQAAFIDYATALELDPYDERTYHYRGSLYYLVNNGEKALSDLNRCIELDPNYASAYSERGRVYLDLIRDYGEAEADFLRALEFTPTDTYVLSSLGAAYLGTRKFDLAAQVMEQALFYDPSLGNTHINLGEAYYYLGEWEKALESYWHGFALQPSSDLIPPSILNRARELEIWFNVTATPTSIPGN